MMRQSALMAVMLVSGTLLWAGAVFADPDRNTGRDRYRDKNYGLCKGNHDCRSRDNRTERRDRDDRREPAYVYDRRGYRDDDRNRDYDRYRYRDYDRDYDIRLRISSYPYYLETPRYRYSYRTVTPYWLWNQGYRPYYYRGSSLVLYPYRTWERRPVERIYWLEDSRQVNVPQQAAQPREQRYCREYYMDADVQGQTQQVYGTACMEPDGSWRIVN